MGSASGDALENLRHAAEDLERLHGEQRRAIRARDLAVRAAKEAGYTPAQVREASGLTRQSMKLAMDAAVLPEGVPRPR